MNLPAAELAHHEIKSACFLGLELLVGPDVLVPRSETELLGREAIRLLQSLRGAPKVIDMCCGSGNLALAIASHVHSARVWGSDLTDSTVRTALANVRRLGLEERVSVAQGDMFLPLRGSGLEEATDLVVSNPPYFSTSRLEGQRAELLEKEPREAFDGGPYGIAILQRVINDARDFLRTGGWIAFEFGLGQERQVAALVQRARAYGDLTMVNDAAGRPRVALATKL